MLIRGDKLSSDQRRQVLAAFIYRWTSDNGQREAVWRGLRSQPTIPLQTDQQWLAEHAFHFTKDGSRLTRNRKHAEPAFLANHA